MLKTLITLATLAGIVACGSDKVAAPPPPPPGPQATVYSATGAIATKVDEFRNVLGVANGAVAGEQPTGRREINWDGAGANPFDNKNDFPANFFNTNVKAGAVFTTSGTGFRNDSTDFAEINPEYAAQFAFSAPTRFSHQSAATSSTNSSKSQGSRRRQ
ncbi:MAG: hypothetical protein ACJ8AK_08620 [Gemmatimonadaceae bacterium]